MDEPYNDLMRYIVASKNTGKTRDGGAPSNVIRYDLASPRKVSSLIILQGGIPRLEINSIPAEEQRAKNKGRLLFVSGIFHGLRRPFNSLHIMTTQMMPMKYLFYSQSFYPS